MSKKRNRPARVLMAQKVRPEPDPIPFGRSRWVGSVLSWEPKNSFGRQKEVPYYVELFVRADNLAEAEARLSILAENEGYALGGIVDIHETAERQLKKKSAIREANHMTPEDRASRALEAYQRIFG